MGDLSKTESILQMAKHLSGCEESDANYVIKWFNIDKNEKGHQNYSDYDIVTYIQAKSEFEKPIIRY